MQTNFNCVLDDPRDTIGSQMEELLIEQSDEIGHLNVFRDDRRVDLCLGSFGFEEMGGPGEHAHGRYKCSSSDVDGCSTGISPAGLALFIYAISINAQIRCPGP